MRISSPEEKRNFYDSLDLKNKTILVSDLRSKVELQNIFLNKVGFVEEDSLYRASELWKRLVQHNIPDIHFISSEFALTIVSRELQAMDLPWSQTPGAARAALGYLNQLMPLLTHHQRFDLVREWFKKNEGSYDRWGHWYLACEKIWQRFLKERMIPSPWASAVLLNASLENYQWNREIVVDVGPHLLFVEAELLQALSKHHSVTVLRPEADWSMQYPKSMMSYDFLESESHSEKNEFEFLLKNHSKYQFYKFQSPLAEIKQAVAQIRKLLDQGIAIEKLALVAPDIGVYWPVLCPYLEEEGILYQRAVTTSLQTFSGIASWLGFLKVKLGKVETENLVHALYQDQEQELLAYDRFRYLYSQIYENEDLKRSDQVFQIFKSTQISNGSNGEVTQKDFITWCMKFWPEHQGTDVAIQLLRLFIQDSPSDYKLNSQNWLQHLEQLAANKEQTIQPTKLRGLACVDLQSAEALNADYIFVMGLTEGNLRRSQSSAILFSDISSVMQQTGIPIVPSENEHYEFELRWLLETKGRNFYLSYAASDFEGVPQSPSLIWLMGVYQFKQSYKTVHVPEETRWDLIQKADWETWSHLRGWSKEEKELRRKTSESDLDSEKLTPFAAKEIKSLSASLLEKYARCPFIVASEKLFKLGDESELDLDLSALDHGTLIHEILSRIIKPDFKTDMARGDLEFILEDVINEMTPDIADTNLWAAMRAKLLLQVERIYQFEVAWRKKYPLTKTQAVEMEFSARLTKEGEFLSTDETEGYPFKGAIDRLDVDHQNHMVLIDYKTGRDIQNMKSWMTDKKLQMGLYANAISSGVTKEKDKSVVGAVYFDLRNLNRNKGYLLSEVSTGLYEPLNRSPYVKQESLEKYQGFLKETVGKVVEGLEKGAFQPKPYKDEICKNCRWSEICRYSKI